VLSGESVFINSPMRESGGERAYLGKKTADQEKNRDEKDKCKRIIVCQARTLHRAAAIILHI